MNEKVNNGRSADLKYWIAYCIIAVDGGDSDDKTQLSEVFFLLLFSHLLLAICHSLLTTYYSSLRFSPLSSPRLACFCSL
jgi:hypothetical protein